MARLNRIMGIVLIKKMFTEGEGNYESCNSALIFVPAELSPHLCWKGSREGTVTRTWKERHKL